ncbi:MAG: hypothetical protein ACI9YH_004880 [Colwellia sp.]|jgi:hypothetical protein
MSLQYSIRIHFDQTLQGEPERVFEAMALFVKGFDGLQSVFIKGFDDNIEFNSRLYKTREGSCIADICHTVLEKTRNASLNKLWDNIFFGLEDTIATVDKVDSENDIKAFKNKVYSNVSANEAYLCDPKADEYEIAKNLKLVDEGMRKLASTDQVEIGVKNTFRAVSKTFSFPRTPDELFSKEATSFPSRDLLTIKNADYSGEGKWRFNSAKLKGKNFPASISDKVWLNRWKNHEFQFWPGDALLVKIVTERIVNSRNKNVSYRNDITKVLEIIPEQQVSQVSLDYE